MDRSEDRTVQADRSKADDAADRLHIYGVARKSAPDEQGYKVKERGVQFNVPKDRNGRGHETITDIHAQVIDSCIAVIISRPLIRANHIVQKIPLYFDETPEPASGACDNASDDESEVLYVCCQC